MTGVTRTRRPDGAVVATYQPSLLMCWLLRAAQYLGLVPGWPEPDEL
ncbi:MAG TPA: hypothetical protein VGN54_06260 [Mycobacteriales bacterium]|jgi:phage terminase large subunit-like protein|nr:hypothetical protein [Mycobacteriales bacterium]